MPHSSCEQPLTTADAEVEAPRIYNAEHKSRLLYWSCVVIGCGVLVPWGATMSAVDYFKHTYPVRPSRSKSPRLCVSVSESRCSALDHGGLSATEHSDLSAEQLHTAKASWTRKSVHRVPGVGIGLPRHSTSITRMLHKESSNEACS